MANRYSTVSTVASRYCGESLRGESLCGESLRGESLCGESLRGESSYYRPQLTCSFDFVTQFSLKQYLAKRNKYQAAKHVMVCLQRPDSIIRLNV